jgi:translin
MTLLSKVHSSLESINKDMKDTEERREKLIKGTRDIIMLCSKSIVSLHHNEMEQARDKMETARNMLDEFRGYAKADLYRYIVVAEQELVEAYGLRSVMEDLQIPSIDDLGVTGPSYITGLLDCIGEIKRLVLDRMRSGRERDAEKLFAVMQEIYNEIYPFAVYDNFVGGVRKKLDVARMLIEDVRATVTEENRRRAMINALNDVDEKLKGKERKEGNQGR